ncbi:MAG: thioredoxin family protein [Pseudomonas sp.]
MDITESSIASQTELTDFDADRLLLDWPGTSLLIFTSIGCASCRLARRELPQMALPTARLAWVDAANNGGLVARYEVFHLPALFVVREGQFFGAVHARLTTHELSAAIGAALNRTPEELP